jgi:hypothetical protein
MFFKKPGQEYLYQPENRSWSKKAIRIRYHLERYVAARDVKCASWKEAKEGIGYYFSLASTEGGTQEDGSIANTGEETHAPISFILTQTCHLPARG